jgi:cytolysin-activating lysine-acyltransferase
MMQQQAHRHTLLSELEWRVVPPLVLDQAKLYLHDKAPLAFVSWARLSAEVAARYRTPPHHLMNSDWSCGEEIWIVDLIAPFGGGQDVITDLREKQFPGQPIHQLAPDGQGGVTVMAWPAV